MQALAGFVIAMKKCVLLFLGGLVGAACTATDEAGSAPDELVEFDDALAKEAPFERACARLHGECSSVCDNLFFECYGDASTCAEQWAAEYFDGFDDPLVDPARLRQCADQVDEQACTSLRPDSVECDYAVFESCVGDRDAWGSPYSPFEPAALVPGTTFTVDLCAHVEEFFEVELSAGQAVDVEWGDDNAFVRVLQLRSNAHGHTVMTEYDEGDPVPQDGTYVVGLESFDRTQVSVTVVVSSGEGSLE